MNPSEALKHYFGYDNFRPGQSDIVESIISKRDTLAILPTGGGKSICFQIPALLFEGTTVVISPLISLMLDQVDALNRKNISASFLNSSLPAEEYQQRLSSFSQGEYKLIYVAPERLQNPEFLNAAKQLTIPLLVIDEAHCISEWGHDFRPPYREISCFAKQLQDRPTIAAFTATATPDVRSDIISSLKLQDPFVHLGSFQRTNLQLQVIHSNNRMHQELHLLRLLRKHSGQTGIVYTATRDSSEYVAKLINYLIGSKLAHAYHGGLDKEERQKIQEQFMTDHYQIIVATNAFGMGVDKPNIRFVIHYHPSTSIENFYQEIGRAGRDGLSSNCYLLFNPFNLKIHNDLINKSTSENTKILNTIKLQAMVHYAQAKTCRIAYLLKYFGEKSGPHCIQCDNCSAIYQTRHPLLVTVSNERELAKIKFLIEKRAELARVHRLPPTEVITDSSLCYLAHCRPKTKAEYAKIPGIGTGWIEKWHYQFGRILVELDS